MPKSIVNDVLPPNRRSIRQIQLSRNKKRPEKRIDDEESAAPPPEHKHPRFPNGRWGLILIVLACIVVLIFAFSSALSGATISVTPKVQKIAFENTITAKKSSNSDLSYEILPLARETREMVPSDGTKHVERRASGTIVIFNAFSKDPQRLIKNTRFESPEGLIYRIDRSVIVPGKTTKDGDEIPGSVEAVAYADAAGEKYNIGLTDFSVPGFKSDTARYSGFFARSKTPMSGGFIGTENTVSEELLRSTKAKLESRLRDVLIAEARTAVPEGFLLYDGAYEIGFEELPREQTSEDSVTVVMRGMFKGYMIPRDKLTTDLLKRAAPTLDSKAVRMNELETMTFKLQSVGEETISFSLKGTPSVIWQFDEAKLRRDLAGKPKRDVREILTAYPSIIKTDIITRPFWKKSLPSKERKIEIRTVIAD